ncbi:MAG: 30S ribosomal protein S20 [candidate division Zixibacteria bacterium RBG-1]|nr:MAG: 30S ribosomal protein S20 [candidate division Zixibacteria bacterium RBG-1]OGC85355.1 MAG: 30S ribosomal protein S20 [candidate division Zixibacteria bacterium RBG_19FT_COMBO_42_43]
MPTHKSAEKALRQSISRNLRNKAVKSKVRTIIKKVETARDKTQAKDLLKQTFSLLDKAVKRNVIHFNRASRTKSRLTKLVNQLGATKI